jgi:hypothetical protein
LARWDTLGTLRPLRDQPVVAVVTRDAEASQNGTEREEQEEIDKHKHDRLPETQRNSRRRTPIAKPPFLPVSEGSLLLRQKVLVEG